MRGRFTWLYVRVDTTLSHCLKKHHKARCTKCGRLTEKTNLSHVFHSASPDRKFKEDHLCSHCLMLRLDARVNYRDRGAYDIPKTE